VHDAPDVELYALHEGRDRLVMIEKYESKQARSELCKGAALAGLRSLWRASSAAVWTRRSSYRTRKRAEERAVTARRE
jgi:hypothetical protein